MTNERKFFLKRINTRKSKGVKNHTQAVIVVSRLGLLQKLYTLAKGKLLFTDVNIKFRRNLFNSSSISHCYYMTKKQIKLAS